MRTHLERLEMIFCHVIDGGVEGKASPEAISALQFAVGAVRDEMYLASHPMAECMRRTQEIMQRTNALEKIACRHVTGTPLWWQEEARAALDGREPWDWKKTAAPASTVFGDNGTSTEQLSNSQRSEAS